MPARSAQAPVSKGASSEGPAPVLPPPKGTPIASAQLESHAPDAFAGFAADGPAEPHDTPLPNGGQVTAVRRTYTHGAQKLQLELSDLLHAPALGELVVSQQGEARKTERVEFRGIEINGYPALVQKHSSSQTGIINMLINGRFLANVKVSPVDTAESAIEIAKALPIAELAKLAPKAALPEMADSTEGAPGEPEARKSEAANIDPPAGAAAR
jgi:hypothetical protein